MNDIQNEVREQVDLYKQHIKLYEESVDLVKLNQEAQCDPQKPELLQITQNKSVDMAA